MDTVYELRCGVEIIGIFPTERKAIKAIEVYIEYLKENNGISAVELPSRIDKYSMIEMSDSRRLYMLERDLFTSIKGFKRYLGV